jgi:hypothetical protein
MPFPCRDPATTMPFSDSAERGQVAHCRLWTADANSHTPYRSPAALKANSHIPCRSHAVPLPRPCRSPTVPNAGRSPIAVCGRQMLIHTYHAVPLPRLCRGLERSLSERHIRGMAWERHDMCESSTAALCKSNGKDAI